MRMSLATSREGSPRHKRLGQRLCSPGIYADVLRVVLAEHSLVTSEVVLRELGRVLRKRIVPPGAIREIDEFPPLLSRSLTPEGFGTSSARTSSNPITR